MEKPKFEVFRTARNGKPAVELVVRNASYDDNLEKLLVSLGYTETIDISNRMSIVCTTAEEIDAARNPLKMLFDAKGCFI